MTPFSWILLRKICVCEVGIVCKISEVANQEVLGSIPSLVEGWNSGGFLLTLVYSRDRRSIAGLKKNLYTSRKLMGTDLPSFTHLAWSSRIFDSFKHHARISENRRFSRIFWLQFPHSSKILHSILNYWLFGLYFPSKKFFYNTSLTESSTNSRTMSRQIVQITKHNLLLGMNIVYFQ